jgi:tetratricopeptide (TPR) repeat protein
MENKHTPKRAACRRHLPWLGAVLVAVVCFVAYIPAMNGGFVWDDEAWTSSISSLLADLPGLARMWATPEALQQYFPLTGTTFWIDHQLWGNWTLPYHLENLVLHLVSAFLFWRLLLRLGIEGAWLAAALFAVHPVMVESVAWIAERKNGLSMVLMLGSLLVYGRFSAFGNEAAAKKRWTPYAGALVLFSMAMMAKASAFVLPVAVLVIVWWRQGRLRWRDHVLPLVPFLLISIAFSLFILWLEVHHVGADGREWPVAVAQRPIIAGLAVWFYLGKFVWPAELHPIYPRWDIDVHNVWLWLAPASVVVLIVGLWLARRRLGRGPIAAVLLFLTALFPVLGFLDVYGMVYSFVADRWAYVPSLPIFAIAAAGVARFAQSRASVAGVFALPVLVVLTWQKAGQYKDAQTLMRAALAGNPRCWLACYNLANDLRHEGREEEAEELFERAIAIWPEYAKAHANLASLKIHQGKDEEAMAHLVRALEIAPEIHAAHFNLGLLRVKRKEMGLALQSFEKAAELLPDFLAAHQNAASIAYQGGDLEKAIHHCRLVVGLAPQAPAAHRDLATVLLSARRISEAVTCLERVVELVPDDQAGLNQLAAILATSTDDKVRDGKRAVALATRADELTKGESAGVANTLAAALAEDGQFEEAVRVSHRALILATKQGDAALAASIRERMLLYRTSRPVRDAGLGSGR